MKRIALLLFLFLLPSVAAAQWVKVGEVNGTVAYIDPDTVRETGDAGRVWAVLDFREGNGSVWSQRVYIEYRCTEAQMKTLAFASFAAPMLAGRALQTVNAESDWEYIAPRTADRAILDRVCAGRKPNYP